ncbi:MAG TPA: TonB family protein [Sphingobium sp.]
MQSVVMPQGGYVGSRRSPIGIGGAIAVHALAAGAFLLMPKEMIDRIVPQSLITYAVPADPPRQDPVQPPPDKVEQHFQRHEEVKPYIPDSTIDFTRNRPDIMTGTFDPIPNLPPFDKLVDPPRAPVFAQAQPDPRYARDLQPNYPPSMQRMEMAGSVTVRVRIGVDGRVLAVEKLSAASDAFWEATREQALRKWRFRPATQDGAPVESERIMTVTFEMN